MTDMLTPVLTDDWDAEQSWKLATYESRGGYGALKKALGQDPADALMVGDDRRADGGAADLGCAVHFVDHLPVEDRPAGLLPVLGLVE